MSEVDFSDLKSATAWFEAQSDEMRCTMASRAALRVVANIGRVDDPSQHRLALSVLRAIITSAVCGVGHTAEVRKMLHSAALSARSAALSADSAALSARSAALSADSAALSADSAALSARSAARSADSAALSARSAALSARSAARSARSAALSATQTDAAFDPEGLVRSAVWSGTPVPDAIFLAHGVFMQSLYSHPDWAFWAQWYRGMWDGTFRNWELATEVALIPDEVWEGEDAVGKVAREIERIKRERKNKDALPPAAITSQATVLIQNATACAVAASGLQQLIKMATDAYCREISNALPTALEPLDMLPGVLDRISLILTSDAPRSDREAELQEALRLTANTVANLNRRLLAAQSEMATYKNAQEARRPKRLFADAFYTKAGEGAAGLVTSKVLWGSIIGGSALLLGGSAEALMEQLGQCYEGIIAPEAPDVLPQLPLDIEV